MTEVEKQIVRQITDKIVEELETQNMICFGDHGTRRRFKAQIDITLQEQLKQWGIEVILTEDKK